MIKPHAQKVLDEYKKQKDKGALSLALRNPTPAGLRDECDRIYTEKGMPVQASALRLFFGPLDHEHNYRHRIQSFDIDKFKPLSNFLTGKTNKTNTRNIALLEWLMSIERDEFFNPTTLPPPIGSVSKPEGEIKNPLPDPPNQPGNFFVWFKVRWKFTKPAFITICVAVLFAAGFGIYRYQMPGKTRQYAKFNTLLSSKQCMYWNHDHYEAISCSVDLKDTLSVALDPDKVEKFKKIMKPDTLTRYAIGRLWYSKINNEVEFFTAPGHHPKHIERTLKPVTYTIIKNYVNPVD